jgi:hypothetical protein
MILFRNRTQTLFESVIEDLNLDLDVDNPAGNIRSFTTRLKLDTALTAASSHSYISSLNPRLKDRGHAYEDNQRPSEEASPIGELESVLRELNLTPGLRAPDVAAIRRNFASRNHPDRMPADLRSIATRRMMIANALLDSYIKSPSGR